MLSRARYVNEEEMQSDNDNLGLDYFVASNNFKRGECFILAMFYEKEYSDEMFLLGHYLKEVML